MKKNGSLKLLPFLKQNWMILLVVVVAALLRTWQLDTKAIMFSDAGRDLLVAKESLDNKTIPLLGIPSSVPRFKQGPVSIWIEMLSIAVFGVNTYVISLVYALLGIAAVIGLYELVCIYVGRKQAILAAALLAISPLAVAHARVIYHTTPLPLALILYLFSLFLLQKNKLRYFLLAGFCFALLFQFELAVTPLFLLLPFFVWYKKIKYNRWSIFSAIGGVALGLLPQIIFDLTHKFAQLGVFALWIGHKGLEFVTFKGGGTTSIGTYLQSLEKYLVRIVSVDNLVIGIALLLLLILGAVHAVSQYKQKKLEDLYLVTFLGTLLLLIGYLVHGAPSEAYFPPFFVLLPILLTHAVFSLKPPLQKFALGVLVVSMLFNVFSIFRTNFFVSTNNSFNYGPSIQEQRQMLYFIKNKSDNNFSLHTFEGYENEFEHFFDNYKWLLLENKQAITLDGKNNFYIENKAQPIPSSEYFYYEFDSMRVFWPIQ